MAKNTLSTLLMGAAVAGLVSGAVINTSYAKGTGQQVTAGDKEGEEKDTCKSKDGKDTCKSKGDAKKKDEKKGDGKEACKGKDGKEACGGKDGCGGKK